MAVIESLSGIDMTIWTLASLDLDSEYNVSGWAAWRLSESQITLVNTPPSTQIVFTGTFTDWNGSYDLPNSVLIEAVEIYSIWKGRFLAFALTDIAFTLGQLKTVPLSELLAGTPITYLGGGGNDVATGSTYHDYFQLGGGDDDVNAGAGDDRVYGDGGDDLILAGWGDDLVYGGAGNDSLSGGSGNDYLIGNRGNDFFNGGEGEDHYVCAPGIGHDTIVDGANIIEDYDSIMFPVIEQISSWRDFRRNHVSRLGDDVLIRIDSDDTLLIKGIDPKDVTSDNFWLHFEVAE